MRVHLLLSLQKEPLSDRITNMHIGNQTSEYDVSQYNFVSQQMNSIFLIATLLSHIDDYLTHSIVVKQI